MNEREAKRMSLARERLLSIAAFFGAPSLRLTMREVLSVPTLCTDGTYLDYNPAYIESHSMATLTWDIAHETGHCLYLHPFRIGNRDPKLANMAGDYVINAELAHIPGLEAPEGILLDSRFDGLSLEDIYAILYREREQQQEQDEQEQGQEQGCGMGQSEGDDESESDDSDGSEGTESSEDSEQEGTDSQDGTPDAESDPSVDANGKPQSYFVPAPTPSAPGEDDSEEAAGQPAHELPKPLTADDWKQIAEQAVMVNRKRGTLPGGADLAVAESRQARVSWAAELREFIEHTIPNGQSWTTPNRRFVAAGIYLPGTYKENAPGIDVVVDTSGSTADMLHVFEPELQALVSEMRPERIRVIYCDAYVHAVDTFTPDDQIIFRPVGGGGTAFQPAFDWIEDQTNMGEEPPAAIVYLTDLDGDNPRDPQIPTLWVAPEYCMGRVPFGRLVKIPITEYSQ